MNRRTVVWAIAIAVIGGVAFALFTPPPAVNKKITGQELSQLQAGGAWLVDVRTNSEFIAGHIPNSLSAPIDQLVQVVAGWSKTQPIIVYAQAGAQSESAAALLVAQGFRRVYSLDGGAAAWTGSVDGGRPTASARSGPSVVKTAGKPLLIDFAGSACPVCIRMAPLVERLKQEYAGRVEFRRYVDSGDPVGDQLSQQFNVEYVPTFVFVNADGSVSGQPIVGGTEEGTLRARIDALKQASTPTTKK